MKPGTRNVETFISKLLAHRHTLVSYSFQALKKRVFCLQQLLVNLKHLHLITHHCSRQPGKGSSKKLVVLKNYRDTGIQIRELSLCPKAVKC